MERADGELMVRYQREAVKFQEGPSPSSALWGADSIGSPGPELHEVAGSPANGHLNEAQSKLLAARSIVWVGVFGGRDVGVVSVVPVAVHGHCGQGLPCFGGFGVQDGNGLLRFVDPPYDFAPGIPGVIVVVCLVP